MLERLSSMPEIKENQIAYLPSFDLAKVESDRPVGDRLLAEVLGVPPDEGGHVVTCAGG